MDALRTHAEQDIGKKVIFKIENLRIWKDWAFTLVEPLQLGGNPMDFHGTKYQKIIDRDEPFDEHICALLRNIKGNWRVVKYEIGATDYPCIDEKGYKIPVNLTGGSTWLPSSSP